MRCCPKCWPNKVKSEFEGLPFLYFNGKSLAENYTLELVELLSSIIFNTIKEVRHA